MTHPDIELYQARAARLERENAALVEELKTARKQAYMIELRLTTALRPNAVSVAHKSERVGHILNTICSMMDDVDVMVGVARDVLSTKTAD